LLEKLIRYCRKRGLRRIVGEVLLQNRRMLELAASLGFTSEYARDGIVRVTLELEDEK
jgi:acetyltransferase